MARRKERRKGGGEEGYKRCRIEKGKESRKKECRYVGKGEEKEEKEKECERCTGKKSIEEYIEEGNRKGEDENERKKRR